MPRVHAGVFAVPFLSAAVFAQTTWIVTGGGAALQNTIVAAAAGDTLDVQLGNYDAITCGKGLRIRLRPGAVIDSGICAVTIASLPAAERFQLDGGMVRGIAASNCAGTIVVDGVDVQLLQSWVLSGCTGPIVFDDVDYSGFAGATSGNLHVFNCTDVTFRDCRLPQLNMLGSRAALQGCIVRPYGFSAPGIQLASGSLTLSGTQVKGSQAVFFSIPQPAIQVDGGTLNLTGTSFLEALEYSMQPAPGVAANGGTVRADPSTIIQGTPAIAGPGIVQTQPMPSLVVTHAATTMTVTTTAVAGDLLATFAGLPSPSYATPWGDAWLLPTDPILDLSFVPPNGTSTFSRTFAFVPPFVLLTLQSVALDAQGGLTLGAPARFCWN
ncbi:MAG: hypothetical protein JNK15_13325 [Planctomycetes bacterium]|nr:hypothetical protein [Planctomycetota bacterium]